MGSSLFNIGLTGLNAAQAGLVTTSHNIANAGTAGYSRQSTVQSTNPAMFTGSGFFGEGTRVDTVKRAYNAFLNNQVLSADTKFNEYDTYSTEISQIDNMLADTTVGLSPALQSFFSGVQEVAANPSSIPARQSMISTAQGLASRLNNLSQRLDDVRSGIETQISDTVSTISTYAKDIADINNKIMIAQQAGSAQPANDLLDQRDQLVQELNKLVRVSTNVDSDGAMSVFIGTGQPLVVGANPTTLKALPSTADPSRVDANIITQNGGTIAIPESLLGGGKLGGLLSMRSGALDAAQNQLGLIAVGISTAVNAQNALGQDLNGNLGGDVFTRPSVGVTRYTNASTAFPTVDYSDVSKLTGDDYKLTFTDTVGNYKLTRVSDGATIPTDTGVGLRIDKPTSSNVGDSFLIQPTRYVAGTFGVAITDTRMIAAAAPISSSAGSEGLLSTIGSSATASISAPAVLSSDKFASLAAANTVFSFSASPDTLSISGLPSGMKVSYTDASGTVVGPSTLSSIPYTPGMTVGLWHATGATTNQQDVSFSFTGTPAAGDSFLLRGGTPNKGTASISAPVVSDTTNLTALKAGYTTLSYNSSGMLTVSNLPPGMAVAYTPLNGTQTVGSPVPYSSGMSIALGHMSGTDFVSEVSFTVSGAPSVNDRFNIGANTAGVSDSRNAVLLGNLQTAKTLLSASGQPSATFQSVYSQLVSAVGNKARELGVNRDAQESLVQQASSAQQSLVGVNLDEEAANLIRYQQAYQAASKVMSVASKLFDQVLALGQ